MCVFCVSTIYTKDVCFDVDDDDDDGRAAAAMCVRSMACNFFKFSLIFQKSNVTSRCLFANVYGHQSMVQQRTLTLAKGRSRLGTAWVLFA